MSKKEEIDFIVVNFEGGQAKFDIRVKDPAQVFTAMLGLEGWLGSQLGLEAFDIREILDEIKNDVVVKPKTSDQSSDDVVDVDPH